MKKSWKVRKQMMQIHLRMTGGCPAGMGRFNAYDPPLSKDELRMQLREALENTARDAMKAAEPRDA